jgi:hypothetical protein
MQYVDGFFELRDIDHPKDSVDVPNANLSCPRAYDIKRLPILRFEPGLHLTQFETGLRRASRGNANRSRYDELTQRSSFSSRTDVPVYKILYLEAAAAKVAGRFVIGRPRIAGKHREIPRQWAGLLCATVGEVRMRPCDLV